ncbi:hypothetical protein PV325_010786 [Microctonus aethiopoides]|nr:hypothetical protein PV325_010786 [Microctonus aethiopoides]
MRILELYAGIGGMHYALQESGVDGIVIAAIEISTIANDVYKHNFPSAKLLNRNIESLTVKEIENMNVDAIFMSPPCQPFTKNGLQKDADDARTISFFHILELIPQLTNLNYILLENVEPFARSASREALISCLEKSKFNYKECLLSPCDFGVPNNRLRYFLIAKKNTMPFCLLDFKESRVSSDQIIKILSNSDLYKQMKVKYSEFSSKEFPPLSKFIKNNLIDNPSVLEANLPVALLKKHLNVLDIRNSESNGSCCFTSAYGRYAEGTGSVYSPLSKTEINRILDELKKNNSPQSNEWIELAKSLKLRYFTPEEVSKIMCFPSTFSFPNSINKKQKYKLIGNSINIHVVSHLILLLNHT